MLRFPRIMHRGVYNVGNSSIQLYFALTTVTCDAPIVPYTAHRRHYSLNRNIPTFRIWNPPHIRRVFYAFLHIRTSCIPSSILSFSFLFPTIPSGIIFCFSEGPYSRFPDECESLSLYLSKLTCPIAECSSYGR
jgi:hypothetical protein